MRPGSSSNKVMKESGKSGIPEWGSVTMVVLTTWKVWWHVVRQRLVPETPETR